jgi:hypothetical protein
MTTRNVGLRHVLRGRSARSIGRLLARAVGLPIGGFQIEARGDELRVRKWSIVAIVEPGFLEVSNPETAGAIVSNSRGGSSQ